MRMTWTNSSRAPGDVGSSIDCFSALVVVEEYTAVSNANRTVAETPKNVPDSAP